ncbi:hypothetical protein Tsubulata_020441 [Turnera subulata]|uniref:Prostaglandin E synthase 2 n=1 Tax=Turnera subulata TaxID=218843 RepID=A0A9Q0GDU1_9ROSI|nr:hypothetical protein Tsubulata_020441 [Turnera subulata]
MRRASPLLSSLLLSRNTASAAAHDAISAGALPHRLLQAALYSTTTSSSATGGNSQSRGQWFNRFSSLGIAGAAAASLAASTTLLREEVHAKERLPHELVPKEVVLYQYEACPFCNKVKAFLDYHDIPYKVVEVNPLSKKEIKWSDYKKVPILVVDGEQLVDSSVIIDEMEKKIAGHSASVHDKSGDDEEQKWRKWVDDHLVHVLSPNIYRTTSEAIESFEYITTNGKFVNFAFVTICLSNAYDGQVVVKESESSAYDVNNLFQLINVAFLVVRSLSSWYGIFLSYAGNFSFTEKITAKYVGAAAMYFVSKKLKKKYNITDERKALYDSAETWVQALNGRDFLGGSKPNLADLAVFGVLKPIRHLQAGREMVEHTRIGDWYGRMENAVGESARVKA